MEEKVVEVCNDSESQKILYDIEHSIIEHNNEIANDSH